MVKIDHAILNSGPFIHLIEIDQLRILRLFKQIFIPQELLYEWNEETKKKVFEQQNIVIKTLTPQHKDLSKYLIEQYGLHLGEAMCIALCKQEKVFSFFSDDLDARETALALGLKVHGTLAIVTKNLREKLITRNEAIHLVTLLYEKSTLYITEDLRDWIIKEIRKYQ